MEAPTAPRTWPIGKRYDGGTHVAQADHARAYALATADDAPAYTGADAICPPMFHVRLMHGLIWQIATDPELGLDMLRLVHGEHDATFHQPIRVGQTVEVRGQLERVDEKPSGIVVTSRLEGWVEGALAVSARTVYFVRAARPPTSDAPRAPRAPEPAPPPPDWTTAVALTADQSLRYAAASLDDNPIHTDPATAAAAGLPGIIVQGLCTMAVSAAAAVRAAAGGDPRRVRRIAARFARPVLNGETLTLHGHTTPAGCTFTTLDAAGRPVLAQGVIEIA